MADADKKFVFNLDKLQDGDILLTISDRRLSNVMAHKTGCRYHHAQLYTGDSSYIHSYELGVQAANPMRDLFELPDDAVALRLRDVTNASVYRNIIDFVRSKVGTQYSLDEALEVLQQPDMDAAEANRQFCTRLVAQAYAAAGVVLVANPDYCSLQDLITSPKVDVITNILREGNPAEIAHALEGSKELTKQEEIHNHILEEARKICQADIQTLDQMEAYIVDHPEFDEQLTQVVKDSGYLDLWGTEMSKNPQNYDFNSFTRYYPEPYWPEVISNYFPIAEKHLYGYLGALKHYQALHAKQPLAYYATQITLLKNLIRQFRQMLETMLKAGEELLDEEG